MCSWLSCQGHGHCELLGRSFLSGVAEQYLCDFSEHLPVYLAQVLAWVCSLFLPHALSKGCSQYSARMEAEGRLLRSSALWSTGLLCLSKALSCSVTEVSSVWAGTACPEQDPFGAVPFALHQGRAGPEEKPC